MSRYIETHRAHVIAPVNNYQKFGSQAYMQFRPTNSFHHRGRQNFENIQFNYWCETCDKGFGTSAQLQIHKQQHQKCNIDGCQFIAHPKVITKHIQMQHSTGLYKKIAKLNDPEEIRKWREERKKKYPTKENIEKKTAELKEKIDRGEKMGINSNRHNKNFRDKFKSYGDQKNKMRFPLTHEKLNNNGKRPLPNNKCDSIPNTKKIFKPIIVIEEEPRKLKPFGGIQDLIFDDDNNDTEKLENDNVKDLIEYDEFGEDISLSQENSIETSKPILCGALTSLICDYGSSEDENDVTLKNNNEGNQVNKEVNATSRYGDNSATNSNECNKTQVVLNDELLQNIKLSNECALEKTANKLPLCKDIISKNSSPNEIMENHQSDNDSGPEEVKVVKDGNIEMCESKKQVFHKEKTSKIKKNKFVARDNRPLKRKLPSTLLEKLLHKEIQQERNAVLQCIRYIVKNNYFDNK